MSSIGPEPGTTYTARLLRASDGRVLLSQEGITGTEILLETTASGDHIVELWAVRAGLESWKKYSHKLLVRTSILDDPHWDNVVALLHFDSDFMDEKGNLIIRQTAAMIAEDGRFSGCLDLNHSSRYIRSEPFDHGIGTDDFTLECWIKISSFIGDDDVQIFDCRRTGYGTAQNGLFYITPAARKLAYWNGKVYGNTGVSILPSDEFIHIAYARESGQLRAFVGGKLQWSESMPAALRSGFPANIGCNFSPTPIKGWNGYIDELRITKGVARYVDDFEPPSRPFASWV